MKKMKLFSLAWPIFIETGLFMLLGFVDVFVLSRYDDVAASSVNAANQAISIATIVFTVISTAGAVMISQYLGAKKPERASRMAALSMTLHLLFGLIISGVFILFSNPILRFIGAKGQVLEYALQYLSIVGGFMFLQALMSSMTVIIRNHGMTKVSMFVTVGMNLLNTILDIFFVLGLAGLPRMGVQGVAIATTVSRALGVVVLAIVLFNKIEKISIFKLLRPFPWKEISKIIKVGTPSALETFLYNVSQLVITSIVLNYLTQTELVAKTYVQNITMFFYMFAVAVGQASQIMIGHLIGAEKYEEANKQAHKSYGTALSVTMSVSLIGVILRYTLIGIFTDDKAVIALGAGILLINVILEFGRTTNLVVLACLRGAGDVVFPTVCALFSMIFISTLGSYILAVVFDLGIYGLWIANALDECFRGVFMIIRWKSNKWRTKRLV